MKGGIVGCGNRSGSLRGEGPGTEGAGDEGRKEGRSETKPSQDKILEGKPVSIPLLYYDPTGTGSWGRGVGVGG